jgi:hypothetical protein
MAIEVIHDRPVIIPPARGGTTSKGNPWYRSINGAVIIEGKVNRLYWRQPNAKYRLYAQIANEAILMESRTPNFQLLLEVIPSTVFYKSWSTFRDNGIPHGDYPSARTYRQQKGPTIGTCIVTQIRNTKCQTPKNLAEITP